VQNGKAKQKMTRARGMKKCLTLETEAGSQKSAQALGAPVKIKKGAVLDRKTFNIFVWE